MPKDLKALANDLRSFKGDLQRAAGRANRRTGEAALRLAREMSSGTFSMVMLSAPPPGLNHPYGLGSENSRGPRGAMPYGDPSWINRQTGNFFRSWTLRQVPTATPTILLVNTAGYARYLEFGTSVMQRRPIDVPIADLVQTVGPQFFAEELARVWRVRFDTK